MGQKQVQVREKDWILFLNEKKEIQDIFVFLEHFDASFVKFKLHLDDTTTQVIPTARIFKIKDRRIE